MVLYWNGSGDWLTRVEFESYDRRHHKRGSINATLTRTVEALDFQEGGSDIIVGKSFQVGSNWVDVNWSQNKRLSPLGGLVEYSSSRLWRAWHCPAEIVRRIFITSNVQHLQVLLNEKSSPK